MESTCTGGSGDPVWSLSLPKAQDRPRVARHQEITMAATITCRLVSLNRWADELRAEQARLVGRARRCRNSLAHGGPFSACTLATVSTFAASHAGLATVTALQ